MSLNKYLSISTIHITNEFSIKNFSISFILKNILEIKNAKFNIDCLVKTKNKNFKTQTKKKIIIFKNLKELVKTLKKYDFIHIHGLWNMLTIFSIIVSIKLKKKLIIHPHGMLLDQAIKRPNFFKSLIKKILINIFKYFYNKNIVCVAITKQEYLSIRKKFKKLKIFLISNKVPVFKKKKINYKDIEKKKNIIFLGRIHPHKNLDLIIDSFNLAKLDQSWKLKIYGLKDDLQYMKHIKKKISLSKNIFLLKPIFDQKKFKVMNSSWLNILVSESEVLSLSVLEAANSALPSLISKNLERLSNDNASPVCKKDKISIAKKLKLVSQWKMKKRLEIGEKVKKIYHKHSQGSYQNEIINTIYKKHFRYDV